MGDIARRLEAIDTLLVALKERIFTPIGVFVPLRYRPARYDDRASVPGEDRTQSAAKSPFRKRWMGPACTCGSTRSSAM
jgi:hypothetical protein